MREIRVSLDSIDKVKNFVSITTKFDAEMELICGRYIIDAKSIMGIFSMNLSEPLIMKIHDGREKVEDIVNALREYQVENN